jgi:hypothetical protein
MRLCVGICVFVKTLRECEFAFVCECMIVLVFVHVFVCVCVCVFVWEHEVSCSIYVDSTITTQVRNRCQKPWWWPGKRKRESGGGAAMRTQIFTLRMAMVVELLWPLAIYP